MKSKNLKSAKAGSNRRKVPSDVSPSTSLPPLVEGQLRCFLQVTVSRVLWTVHKPPPSTFIRLRWWGESSNGTHFFPRDGSLVSQKTIKTTARFPIRCGPKQFTSYLTDMGSLVLEVLTKQDHLPIARAQVAGISRLSLSHPINGFYTLVSPTSEKLGEIQVSLSLEPLTEAYNSSTSVPTTDISTEAPQVTMLAERSHRRPTSAGSGKESAGTSSGNTPRGKDNLYFQSAQKDTSKKESLENQLPITDQSQKNQTPVNLSSQQPCQATNDLLSVILERGNKLRDAMVVSALNCDIDSATALKDAPLPLPKDNILTPSTPAPPPSGMLLQNILHADSSFKHSDDVAAVLDSGLDCTADMENKAVDLLLGSLNTSPVPLWDGEGSFPESLSGHSSVCGDSELNDPQYDQSLLENLFYSTPMSAIRPDDAEVIYDSKSQEKSRSLGGIDNQLTHPGLQIIEDSTSEHQQSPYDGEYPLGLSKEQLTLIRLARVTIDSLTVHTNSTNTTPRKASSKGKPPRPIISKRCFYFVEYVFPVVSTSSRHDRNKAVDGDVTRAISSKVTGGVVKFHHHCVFPVHLSRATVEQWWRTDLIFKIYSRKSDQKKPVLIGKAAHPLRCLLQSKELSQSVVLPVESVKQNGEIQEIGPLKVSLELAADNKDFSSDKIKTRVAWSATAPSHTIPNPQRESSPRSQHVDTGMEELPTVSTEASRLDMWATHKASKVLSPHPGLHTSPHKSWQQVEEDPEVLLHTLLMVPDGKNFHCGPRQALNVYLNCKLFWSDETARSVISWGQTNPSFNFVQVTPVALTSKLLERMKNNVMVIEVWQKTRNSGQDQILGLVKLPLHQFYMSFREPKITHLLLQAQYPVLGVDCYMPVIDVFSGSCKGNLRVVLAMGRAEQILDLQRARDDDYDSLSHLMRPVHLLDHQQHAPTKVSTAQKETMTEHVFVIRVGKVKGLTPLQSTVWGEADCYVQYVFPVQEGDSAAQLDQSLIESSVNLKPFRTTTTLCVPDPVFSHSETHVLLAPEGVPVQRLLLSSLSHQGQTGGGGVQFEVWCRYYYPNVRDQLVAKGMLPLSKLCAMVTMQRQQSNDAQMFSLPLVPRTDSPTGHQPQPSGLLDVCIQYKHRPVRPEGQSERGAASRVVTLVVQVHRASGLQAAARVLTQKDERLQYYADVGVNAYITVQLSFLPERERRSTRVVARTFCPDFDYHMEMPCDLLTRRSSGETCSLAEQLEEASAVFTVWNRDSRKAVHTPLHKDVILGAVKIPLANLIHKTTGISGWFGVYASQDQSSSHEQHILVGGLEISVTFAHHSERERVIKAAQGLGWEMTQKEDDNDGDIEEAWEESMRKVSLTFSIPRVWIPVHCLLLPGHTELQRSTYCYFRYKFYDQEAFCSQLKHPTVEDSGEEDQATVSFQGTKTVQLRSTQPLMWYLREERLEVQVWVTFRKDRTLRPHDMDRLVGSAFVDLSSLTKRSKQKLIVSGVYPLFRRSAADLSGAALRVHITLTTGDVPNEFSAGGGSQEVDNDSQGEHLSEEEEAEDQGPMPTTSKQSGTTSRQNKSSVTTPDFVALQTTEISIDESFPVSVTVDRAMHLNLKGCPLVERSGGMPCCCVSYITADSAEPVSTAVIANTDSPVWEHHHECRLSKQLLIEPQQSLVFKVWHKGDMERVIGFASVDLSPLLCGFPSVCGWYNVTDFSGQCHGQLKVSITPLKGVQDLRGQRKSVNEEAAKNSSALFQAPPLSYQTTATYSSFPAHISRYPEQKISSPDRTNKLFSERLNESDRHCEHVEKVRLYHQSLQEQLAAHPVCSSSAIDIHPSSSVLFSALRKNLSELDNIQRYFSQKLTTPTFPSVTNWDCHSKPEEQQDSETDTRQLLLKSNQLVGEVNNIISGLGGRHVETIASYPQSSFTTPPIGDIGPHTLTDIPRPPTVSEFPQKDLSPLLTPQPKTSENYTNSEAQEEDENSQHHTVTVSEDDIDEGMDEDRDGTDCIRDKEADEDDDDNDEDQDYEEFVVKPRHLNEVTSLTDKTSPWTSILSDPGLVSLERLELPEEPELIQEEVMRRESTSEDVNLTDHSPNRKHSYTSLEEREYHHSDHSDVSTVDTSDSESDGDRTQNRDNGQSEQPNNTKERPDALSPTPEHTTGIHASSSSTHSHDAHLQTSVSVAVPNFFLPTHQLEASMRAIRLAPSFSQSSSDPGSSSSVQNAPHRRGPRLRPIMSPSSMKKETARIAQIFAAHFNEDQ